MHLLLFPSAGACLARSACNTHDWNPWCTWTQIPPAVHLPFAPSLRLNALAYGIHTPTQGGSRCPGCVLLRGRPPPPSARPGPSTRRRRTLALPAQHRQMSNHGMNVLTAPTNRPKSHSRESLRETRKRRALPQLCRLLHLNLKLPQTNLLLVVFYRLSRCCLAKPYARL